MEFEIDQSRFISALGLAQTVADKRSNNQPILANVLLRATKDNKLVCSATDMMISVTETIPVEVKTPGSLTLGVRYLHNVVRTLTLLHEEAGRPFPVVRYRAKVKLHGSNCAVLVGEHDIATQSRTTMLTPRSDYKGFSAWVHEHAAYFRGLRPGLVVFGEWCGPGVEPGMAVSQAPRKLFAVFAIRDGARIIMAASIDEAEPRQSRAPWHHRLGHSARKAGWRIKRRCIQPAHSE